MTDDRQWELHRPVTARRPVEPGAGLADWQVVGCHGPDPDRRSTCAWRSTPESFSTAGYAAHLQELGAPDHIVHYWRFWAELVEMPWGGRIHRDALARELADYTTVMTEASAVYCELADLSKPNTAARHVIAGAEQRFAGRYADYLCDAADFHLQDGEGAVAEAMIDVAEGWRPGCWEDYRRGRARVTDVPKAREEKRQENVTAP
jgi:hypothetical protein